MSHDLSNISFRAMTPPDLPLLHEWLGRPHVAEWWGPPADYAGFEKEYSRVLDEHSTVSCHIAMRNNMPVGFVQSYVVMHAGDGWWENETDPGARGMDQFLANVDDLGRGLGTEMVSRFVARLFDDSGVTRVQADPSPDNDRAIRCYQRAGFELQGNVWTPDGPAVLMTRAR
ncbi:MAG: GNAT family N-acetyltransferase [Betaproteobacteria bacterium]